ncbi:peptidase inhibitor family I36 protein [Streptomyces sp. NPDC054871]
MIRRPFTSCLLAASAATALVFTSGTAAQADEPSATAAPAQEGPVNPVIAEYDGRKINLAESWEGADSCTELPGGEVHCYDSDEEAIADPELPTPTRMETLKAASAPVARAVAAPPSKCFADYWCLYADANYKGKLLRLSSSGKKDLKEWGFRDKLSSVYYWVGGWSTNYGDAKVIDLRSGLLHDRERRLGAPAKYSNFRNLAYPGGGNWNDKVDVFQVRRA